MNILDHIETNNLKNKDQCNDTISYEPKIYNKFSLSSGPLIYTLPVVTVIPSGGKKNRAIFIDGLTCL